MVAKKVTEETESNGVGQNGEEAGDTAVNPAGVTAALKAAEADKAELLDQLKRSQAEFQNFRKRAEREKVEFAEYAGTETVRALLPLLDDFERSLKVECTDRVYAKGMELIYQRFYDSLKKLGLEPVVAVGQPFDPHVHHAVEMTETDEAPDHTVLDEYQRGYNFKGRLMRAAMVRVAVAPSTK